LDARQISFEVHQFFSSALIHRYIQILEQKTLTLGPLNFGRHFRPPVVKVIVSKGKSQVITKSGERDGQCPTASDVQSRCKKSSNSSSELIGRTTSLHCKKHLKVCTTATTGTETENVNEQGRM
jgi:hypothetical protein